MLALAARTGKPVRLRVLRPNQCTAQLLADLGITWLGHTLAIEFMLLPGGCLISDLALNSDASATGGGLCHTAERPSRWAAAEIVTRHTACMIRSDCESTSTTRGTLPEPSHCVQGRRRGSQWGPGRILPWLLARKPSDRLVGPFSRQATCAGPLREQVRARMEGWKLLARGRRHRGGRARRRDASRTARA